MIIDKSFKLIIILVMVTVNLIGCNKKEEEKSQGIKIYPEVRQELKGYDNIIEEVNEVIKYVYNEENKPNKGYMEHIDNLIDERENQRIYLDDFLGELDRLSKLVESGLEQEGNNTVGWEDEQIIDDEYKMEIDEIEDSVFIRADESGRDYIDLNDLEIYMGDVFFVYNNTEYMLDMSEHKETMREIRLGQYNYKYIYGEEVNEGELELVYLDTKTGKGKTIRVNHNGKDITMIDFEL